MLSRNNSLLSPHSFSVDRTKSRACTQHRITALHLAQSEAKIIQRMKWEDVKSARSLKIYIFKSGEVIQIIKKSNSKILQMKEHIYLELGKLQKWLNYLIHKDLVEPGARSHSGITEWPILISAGEEGAALSLTFVQELPWLRGITMGTPAKLMALSWSCLFSEGICI